MTFDNFFSANSYDRNGGHIPASFPAPVPVPVDSSASDVTASAPPELAPVLQGTADAVGGAKDALFVEDAVADLNSDGDTVHLRMRAAIKGELQVGVKGQQAADIAITQNGDGAEADFTVRLDRKAYAAVMGQLSLPNLPLKGELGVEAVDAVEMRFDNREDATRAGKIVQRLAIADSLSDATGSVANPMLISAGSVSGGGLIPGANPLNKSGAPGLMSKQAMGITAEDEKFLQNAVSAYEQTLSSVARGAVEAKLPQVFGPVELAAEGRLQQKRSIVRRVELPTETEAGSLSYTMKSGMTLTVSEKMTLDPAPSTQLVAGVPLQNRFDAAKGGMSVTAEFDIPAGSDVTRSPVADTALPEFDVLVPNGMVPDRVSASINAEWRDQTLLDPSRGDSQTGEITANIENPEAVGEALWTFFSGDPAKAAQVAGATLTKETMDIDRTGINTVAGLKLQVGEGNSLELEVGLEAGVDDVVTKRTTVLPTTNEPVDTDSETETHESGTPPVEADPTPEVLVVVPRVGLTLRDAPDGARETVFQHGTFLTRAGDTVTDEAGAQWVPVKGTDLQDEKVEGYVAAQYLREHPADQGAMDATGRINPELEHERFDEVRVKDGDNLWDLAKKHGVSFREMVALNDEHLISPELIFEGDTVYIPGTARGPEPVIEEKISQTSKPPVPKEVDSAPSPTERTGAPSPDTTSPAVSSGEPQGGDKATPQPKPGPDVEGRPDLEEVLKTYQVETRPTVTWRPDLFGIEAPGWAEGVVRRVGDIFGNDELRNMKDQGLNVKATEPEAQMLRELNEFQQHDWLNISKSTLHDAIRAFPQPEESAMSALEWNNDGHVDAYRHTLWNARMTKAFGEEWTAAYATAHEMVDGNPGAREAMDLYNNEVGRRIAATHPDASDEELQNIVRQAVLDGETVVIDPAGALVWSDTIEIGGHGEARGNELPADENHGRDVLKEDETAS